MKLLKLYDSVTGRDKETLLSNLAKDGIAISFYLDTDNKFRPDLRFIDTQPEGFLLLNNYLYGDHEWVRELKRGMDDEFLEFTYTESNIAMDLFELDPNYQDKHYWNARENYFIHGDPNYYFQIKLEGEWSALDADNDLNIDFTANPIFVELYTCTRANLNAGTPVWVNVFRKEVNYVSGNTIVISEEFIIEQDDMIFLGYNLSMHSDGLLDTRVTPIDHPERFWKTITVTRKLKTNWEHRFEIPASDADGISLKQGELPNGANEGLPFNGYYDCFVSCQVKEETSVASEPASCAVMQTLKLQGKSDSDILVERSGVYIPVTPPGTDKWMNRNLGGAARVYVSDASIALRRITYKVNLPNGSNKQLEGGYLHVRYVGANQGLIRK